MAVNVLEWRILFRTQILMQINQQLQCDNRSSGELSVVLMPTLIAIDEVGLDGYELDETSEIFLRSDVGIAIWAEHDGSCHKLEGSSKAKLIQTSRGPVVEIYNREPSGLMKPQFRIRCVDLLGLAPAIHSRIAEYRDLLAVTRVNRVMH